MSSVEDEAVKAVDAVDINDKDENKDAAEDAVPGPDIYKGKKPRRRSSATKKFLGDALNLEMRGGEFQAAMEAAGEAVILLSDFAGSVNAQHVFQQFALAVTEGSLYLLDTDKDYAIVRQIPVKAIASVQLSTLPDNFMAVKLSDGSLGADLLLLSSRKTEIVTILGDAFRDTEKRDLEIKLGNSIDFFLGEGGARQVRFERSSTNEEDEGVKYFIAKPGKGEKITFDCVEDAKTA